MKLPKFLADFDVRSPKIQIMLGIIIVTLLSVYLWYSFVFDARIDKKKELDGHYQIKQNELNNIYAMKPQLKNLRESITQLQVQLDSLRSIFPDKKEIPKLINEITRVANSAGIFTNKFNPLPDVTREHYVENNYYMSVIGGYHELATFFSHLADFELIINLSNVAIRLNPGVTSSISVYELHGGTINTVVATFTMTTFSSRK